jgi:hypothetical protein
MRGFFVRIFLAILSFLFIGLPASVSTWWYLFSSIPPYQWFQQKGWLVNGVSPLWVFAAIGVVMLLALILSVLFGKKDNETGVGRVSAKHVGGDLITTGRDNITTKNVYHGSPPPAAKRNDLTVTIWNPTYQSRYITATLIFRNNDAFQRTILDVLYTCKQAGRPVIGEYLNHNHQPWPPPFSVDVGKEERRTYDYTIMGPLDNIETTGATIGVDVTSSDAQGAIHTNSLPMIHITSINPLSYTTEKNQGVSLG